MKNFGTFISCLVLFFACSTPYVKVVKLSDGSRGYDLSCIENLENCRRRAKSLCKKGQYRIHNTYFSEFTALNSENSLVMRFQCIEKKTSLQQCSLPGVNCIL